MNSNLTPEEAGILEAYAREELKPVDTPGLRKNLIAAARDNFKKDKRVNIRMSGNDLERLQKRVLIEGIPYQTLMSSVLHKSVNGRLVENQQD